VALLSFV